LFKDAISFFFFLLLSPKILFLKCQMYMLTFLSPQTNRQPDTDPKVYHHNFFYSVKQRQGNFDYSHNIEYISTVFFFSRVMEESNLFLLKKLKVFMIKNIFWLIINKILKFYKAYFSHSKLDNFKFHSKYKNISIFSN